MSNFLTINEAIKKAKQIQPRWIAVNKDRHIVAHVEKPELELITGYWISTGLTWDLGFYQQREQWKTTLRDIEDYAG